MKTKKIKRKKEEEKEKEKGTWRGVAQNHTSHQIETPKNQQIQNKAPSQRQLESTATLLPEDSHDLS